ncbi:hypothetical protein LTR36_000766 [Oleoguttula mirabilis]|uniref:Uncharacterized protein n=1 Tax=Oleoguttula mirabilis TaxID=1507867 RepID=A0AAV9J4Z8_9PEZI|nr:hypothetical protein LTR36_000766 [Oleoguttula mirabilis]
MVIGKKDGEIKASKWHENGFQGIGNVWASLRENETLRFSFAPPEWKGGAKFTSVKDITFELDKDPKEIVKQLRVKREMAHALTSAEEHVDEARRITRIEAILASEIADVRKVAVMFLQSIGELPPPPDQQINRPKSRQKSARALFQRLQALYLDRYGEPLLKSPEAVCIGANILRTYWRDLPNWFRADPAYLDGFLIQFHQYVYRSKGGIRDRATLWRIPTMANMRGADGKMDGPVQDEEHDTYRDLRATYGGNIATHANLNDLIKLSPIAQSVLTADRSGA